MAEEGLREQRASPYRLNLVPGEEQRRPQWNLILVSDIPVTVDFFHTDMLERVVSIKKTNLEEGGVKDDSTRKERNAKI